MSIIVFDKTPKAEEAKIINRQMGLHSIKKLMKGKPMEREKIFANHASDKDIGAQTTVTI